MMNKRNLYFDYFVLPPSNFVDPVNGNFPSISSLMDSGRCAQYLPPHIFLYFHIFYYPARALRALGLLLADGTPTGGRGGDFLSRQPDFFTETAVTPERKVEKSFPRWEINRHVEG